MYKQFEFTNRQQQQHAPLIICQLKFHVPLAAQINATLTILLSYAYKSAFVLSKIDMQTDE